MWLLTRGDHMAMSYAILNMVIRLNNDYIQEFNEYKSMIFW